MNFGLDSGSATLITALASAVYAVVSALSLLLLARQIRDARRFGAAPALYALLKEMDDLMAALSQLGERDADHAEVQAAVGRCLEFYERVEHLRSAGMVPSGALRRAFGNALSAHLADPRFVAVMRQDARQHDEVLHLASAIGRKGVIAPRYSAACSAGVPVSPAASASSR
jgi:hypothetical protein